MVRMVHEALTITTRSKNWDKKVPSFIHPYTYPSDLTFHTEERDTYLLAHFYIIFTVKKHATIRILSSD